MTGIATGRAAYVAPVHRRIDAAMSGGRLIQVKALRINAHFNELRPTNRPANPDRRRRRLPGPQPKTEYEMRRTSTPHRFLSIAAVVAAMASTVSPAIAQSSADARNEPIGRSTFMQNCAACHGGEGKGNGPLAELLTTKIPDLTTITSRNKGIFPQDYIYRIIDGRDMKSAHGTREMPVWGNTFLKESVQDFWPWGSEQVVRGRILETVYYVQSIQGK